MTLVEIAFIYTALKKYDSQRGTIIFIKLLLNLKEKDLPFIIIETNKS